MKIPSSFLFDLVHSLTKSEKRYIKVQAGDRDKDYIQLMDALLAQKQFDEEKLIVDHLGAKFLKHLPVNKRYLFETLLKGLSQFGYHSIERKIFEKINAVNILTEKGLLKAAASELKKGKSIATKYEFFGLQLLLSDLDKKLNSQQRDKKTNTSLQEIYEADLNRISQLNNTNQYWHLTAQIIQFQTSFQKIQNPEQRKYVEELANSPQLNDFSLATNFKSKLYFFQANAVYQFILGNAKEAYNLNRQFLDFLEEQPHFLRLYTQRYLATLNNMLIDSLIIGNYEALETGIERLVSTVERSEFKSIKNIESRVFRQRYLLLINWSLSQKDFKKALVWIPEIEKGLERFGKKIERHHRITFYYLSGYIIFQNGQYDRALHWNNLIINDSKEDVVKEIFYFARILNLLIHFELGNFNLLTSLLLSTPRYFKKRRPLYKTEKTLIRFLGSTLSAVDKKEKRKLFDAFKLEIGTLSEQASEKRVFNYLDLKLWNPEQSQI